MTETPSSIPVFILAGGLGTRLSEETTVKPKPMVEIGDTPLLVHIMRWYYRFGFNDFVICAGYKSWEIKNYFLTYHYRFGNLDVDHRATDAATGRSLLMPNRQSEAWRVRVIDTGDDAMTGCRLARAFDYVSQTEKINTFALTYGDGLCNVNLRAELEYHLEHGKVGTVLTVRPKARFGELNIEDQHAVGFMEKPMDRFPRVNGGFFFFEQTFRNYISSDPSCILERAPLEALAEDRQLRVYPHEGFWTPIDTLSDKQAVQALWDKGEAPWVNNVHHEGKFHA